MGNEQTPGDCVGLGLRVIPLDAQSTDPQQSSERPVTKDFNQGE